MSEPIDLTRWNRSGLERFRYIDENAATLIEMLRLQMISKFGESSVGEKIHLGALGPAHFDNETILDTDSESQRSERQLRRSKRMLKNYHGERGDWGWEMLRSFSRACYVLTEHIDAYANESYLGTATQWENVRRLVGMLDYSPAAPVSASTNIALQVKEGMRGNVKRGLQISYAPPEGDALVFETLAAIDVDARLNALRLKNWNINQHKLGINPDFVLSDAELSAGMWGVVVRAGDAATCQVESVDTSKLTLSNCASIENWRKGEVEFLAGSKQTRVLRLNGEDTVTFDRPHGLSAGSAIAWKPAGVVWYFAHVVEADKNTIRLEGNEQPAAGANIYSAVKIERNSDDELLYPLSETLLTVSTKLSGVAVSPKQISYILDGNGQETSTGVPTANKVTDDSNQVFLVRAHDDTVGAVLAKPTNDYILDGDAGGLGSGQWVVADTGAQKPEALWIKKIEQLDDGIRLVLERSPDGNSPYTGGVKSISGPFKHRLRTPDYDRNEIEIPDAELASLPVEGDVSTLDYLSPGRLIIIGQQHGETFENATEVTVTRFSDGKLSFQPALVQQSTKFTYYNTVIRANVVYAGHGESKPVKVLGSGDATVSNQAFIFPEQGVSFILDSTMSTGVAAAIDVIVEERIWEQVSALNDSGPEDTHYSVRMTEDGYIQIGFGDGQNGRRLPSGRNNIRIRYRKGSGTAGNVDARSLADLAKPDRLVESVVQPLPTLLGNDMEEMNSIKEQAASGALSMGRAVSLGDFSSLATRHSSIWQAKAFRRLRMPSRVQQVMVTLVPAGGGDLGDLGDEIGDYLRQHAIPGVYVEVQKYDPLLLDLNITVFIQPAAFTPRLVMDQVRYDLLDTFSLKRRKLGQSLFLSEVYEVVEAVQGVEYSSCRMKIRENRGADTTNRQELPANENQVIFISDEYPLEIDFKAFKL